MMEDDTPLPTPDAPEWLSGDAAELWARYAPQAAQARTLTDADHLAFSLLCETLSDMQFLQTVIREEGVTIPGQEGVRKAHPALRQLESCRAHALKMLTEFGLTAKSRKMVKRAPSPKRKTTFQSVR